MRRHETDWYSLSIGGLYLVIAAVHLGTQGTGDAADLRWAVPGVLILLGVLGLVGATRGWRGSESDREPQPAAVTDPAVDEPQQGDTRAEEPSSER